MNLSDALEHANETTLGSAVMAALLLCGVYLTFRSGFFQLRGWRFIIKNTFGTLLQKQKKNSSSGISPFQAVTTALAGTMGVGNIAGVATALVAGGPGAIFWMWVSAVFGMVTKYAEIFLAVRFRITNPDGSYSGGPMYYIKNGMKSKHLAAFFAVLCTLASLGIGNMTQSNSISTAVESVFQIPLWVSGMVAAILIALVIFGGIRRIATVTELIIPFISILYICISGAFLWMHRQLVPDAFRLIITDALSLRSAAGGAMGYTFARSMRFGLSRGVFTNEAGLGSAPIAHAAANTKSPAHQGVWGIFEVFLDTIVVCTITALVLLCADGGALWQSGPDGAALTSAAFSSGFHRFGGQFIAISIVFFALSAMLGWCYYGEQALGFLCHQNKTAAYCYRILFLICVFLGATGELRLVWALSDSLNALLAIPNIIAIIALRRYIEYPTRNRKSGFGSNRHKKHQKRTPAV